MASPGLMLTADRNFTGWLRSAGVSLALTTYQTNRLLLLGSKDGDRFSLFERHFERPMGLFVESDQAFWLSTRYQLWRFVNALHPGQIRDGADRLYVPRQCWTTGDVDIHDLVLDEDGRPVFVVTTLNGLATVSASHSVKPLWHPPFIGRWAAEDRCHLNGLARRDERPRYATAVAATDVVDGWRDHRRTGGLVLDIDTGAVVARGLSMPHSPRWYRDRLWLLNSGTGEFGHLDAATGAFVPLAFCSGYARGLAFHGNHAVVGLSKPRDASFTGLALDDRLAAQCVEPRCGLLVIDLDSGDAIHWVRFDGVVTELYDVQILPGVVRPQALGFKTDDIARFITLEPA